MEEKEVMKVDVEEIPTDEELKQQERERVDVSDELKNLGRQVGDTIRTAWESEERQRFEAEVREGVQSFMSELNKALTEVRESDAAHKVKEEAGEIGTKVGSAEITQRALTGLGKGLQWLSQELGRVAAQFTPPEKQPEEAAPATDEAPEA